MERLRKAGIRADSRMRVLLTAAEAYPALERAFLESSREIWASFRIFDLDTRLRSRAGRAIGDTWFDLVEHTLRRGVAVTLILSDFDPCARPDLHRGTWRSVRMLYAAAELAGPRARLRVIPAMHPARTGLVPRLLVWPLVARRLLRNARWLNAMPASERETTLREVPGLLRLMKLGLDGQCFPRLIGLPQLYPATHHQKLAVFDRKRLYIGGLDLNERRYDTPDHDRPGGETWQDVQLLLEGPVVAEAQIHLETFLDVVAGRAEPAPPRRFLRTLSRRRRFDLFHFGPEPVAAEIHDGHAMLARRSRKLIYLETQYFRDRGLAQTLARAARENPGLGMILILPAAPDEVAFDGATGLDARFGEFLQARALRILRDGFGARLFIGATAQPRRPEPGEAPNDRAALRGAPLVYIHTKVSIFDDRAAIVSSANLNGRSLHWDTEAGVFLNRHEDIVALRERVMRHWLPPAAGDEFLSLDHAVQAWRALALANAKHPPDQRHGFILPYDLRAAEAFGTPAPLIPDEMV